MAWRNSPVNLYFVLCNWSTITQWCYGLKCIALGDTDDITIAIPKVHDIGIVYACRYLSAKLLDKKYNTCNSRNGYK